MHHENVSRSNWNIGVIEKFVVGKDYRVRGAKVRFMTKGKPVYVDRPVQVVSFKG